MWPKSTFIAHDLTLTPNEDPGQSASASASRAEPATSEHSRSVRRAAPALSRQAKFTTGWTSCLLLALIGPAPAAAKTSALVAPAGPGQLPHDAVPQHYAITLRPDIATLTFTGSETVELDVLHPTKDIVLNALDLTVSRGRLVDSGLEARVLYDPNKQTVTLRFPRPLRLGRHRLELDFGGKINASGQGLFYSRYQTPAGQQKTMLCTQMEPTDARRVFPVWDEPAYRSRFELTAEVPESFTAVSNMPGTAQPSPAKGSKRIHFAATPGMSSYLVVFCAGEFEILSDTVNGVEVRIVTTEGKRESARYAMEATKKLLPYFDDYFGLRYPLPKLDLIAVPGVIRGGMENWGGITFSDSVLLFDPKRSSQRTKEHIFSVVAHELAHQWFGNLVTMRWWDDLWLNEGFATWMQTKATAHFNPAWQMWPRADRSKQQAMDIDARKTTHPIRQTVQDPSEAARAFDAISYSKAGAVIRMIEGYLGQDVFRAGIRRYIAKYQYGNTVSADLWQSLEATSHQPIRAIASTWIDQPGFPVVQLQSRCRDGQMTLDFKQQRFAVNDPGAKPLRWSIPLSFKRVPNGQPAQNYLLSTPSGQAQIGGCTDATQLNPGNNGYYRVQYSPPDRAALFGRFGQLDPADRLNLLSDTWALVQGGRMGADEYLGLAEKAKDSVDLAIWEQILATLREIDQLQIRQPGRPAFQRYGRALLGSPYRRLGWDAKPDESELDALLRTSVLSALGHFEEESVIKEARRRFADFLHDETSLAADLRPVVFNVVGRYAGHEAYQQLHDLARRANSAEQKQLLYGAMSLARDPALASRTLALALSDEVEPGLAANLVPKVAIEGEHATLAWSFLKENYDHLLAKLSLFSRYRYLSYVAQAFNENAEAREFADFAGKHLPKETLPEIRKAVERIEFRHLLRRRELPKVNAWICQHPPDRDGSSSRLCN